MNIKISQKFICLSQMSDVQTYFRHLALRLGFKRFCRQMSKIIKKTKMFQTSKNLKLALGQKFRSQMQMSAYLPFLAQRNLDVRFFNPLFTKIQPLKTRYYSFPYYYVIEYHKALYSRQ